MYVTERRAARTAARVLVVPAALVVALATAVPQAVAHTELETRSPGADASLAGLPPRVTLTFSDTMTEKYAQVAVTAADGTSVAQGEPEVDGDTVTLALDTGAPAGRYTVGYRVVSADGHPVSGSYAFTVKAAQTARATPVPSATAQDTAPASSAPAPKVDQAGDGGSSGMTVPVLAGAGVLAVAGAVGVYAARRRRTRHGD
ncbi:copper resistance CopC family protein [Streptomyces dysideae]|uniref:CopC domain-containing protein n=1 Tax=Streptomyces dysideae TaxID=909626 RepID=A0A101USU1_9ACTN|nr:copper resistance CopC family protein [Streptomyces dysideae]KUO16225.1 hypothetical protein AQJ91_36995 [Streptomyces dysideae]